MTGLSGQYGGVIEFLRRFRESSSKLRALKEAEAFLRTLGFTSFTCGRVPADAEVTKGVVVASTRPKTWLPVYFGRRLHQFCPILKEMKRRTTPFTRSDIRHSRTLAPEEQEVVRLAEEHGMVEAFIVPLPSGKRNGIDFISAAGPALEITSTMRQTLTLAMPIIFDHLVELAQSDGRPAVTITAREREVLYWVAAGKSDWQIGQILGISAKTVNFHIENVKRKFGVATRIQAVITADRAGYIAEWGARAAAASSSRV